MIKLILAILLLFNILDARENPFFPAKDEKDIPYTSNENRTLPQLKKATITLPSQARIINKVTLEYKCLDGSIEKKSINLQNSIDWHLPIVISQRNRVSQEKITRQTQSRSKSKSKNKTGFKRLASFKYGTFLANYKRLKILTNDKIIRDFMLVNPHRIVIDFKRDTTLKTYAKDNTNTIFKKIRVGNHLGYYRVVIELDGQYRYKKQKISDGYMVVLD